MERRGPRRCRHRGCVVLPAACRAPRARTSRRGRRRTQRARHQDAALTPYRALAPESVSGARRAPTETGTRLLLPSPQGGSYDACNWRRREFDWAREAAGFGSDVTPYTLRHSGISWALHAGIPASDVARFGGTSTAMLEARYHHLLSTSAGAARQRLDAFSTAFGPGLTQADRSGSKPGASEGT